MITACERPFLTASQLEVLSLIAAGLTSKQVARRLGKAGSTVQLHLHCARRRTDTRTTPELVALAVWSGWI